jgi:hypothetical protein
MIVQKLELPVCHSNSWMIAKKALGVSQRDQLTHSLRNGRDTGSKVMGGEVMGGKGYGRRITRLSTFPLVVLHHLRAMVEGNEGRQ